MSKVIIPDTCFHSRNSDNIVLLNYKDDIYYGLDETGSIYWELIQEYKEINLVVEKMFSKFPYIPKEQIKNDLDDLITALANKGLVKVEKND